ncbi:MAG TPA: ion channel [Deinococcales bacterium]|nr:ion channel [Deinococcales bacterium]
MNPTEPRNRAHREEDLGFGRVMVEENAGRFLNKDGSFNVRREGLSGIGSLNAYYFMLTIPWSAFFGLLAVAFLVVNLAFAGLFSLAGPGGLHGDEGAPGGPFVRNFFFSVHTLATIGYGNVYPASLATNVIVMVEAFLGLLGVALSTGLFFARFARPATRVLFSRHAIVAPYRGGRGFMLRVVNGLRNQVIDVQALLTLSLFETVNGKRVRRFHTLPLERDGVTFMPLAWTIVHPIDPDSPLWGLDEASFREAQPEFDVVLRGLDDRLFQTVHARTSYRADEVAWGRRFSAKFVRGRVNAVAVDVRRLHLHEPAPLPEPGVPPGPG